ncbi:MAG: hypothetical protein RIG62_11175 [Cyclobacteriaceae bacterium]
MAETPPSDTYPISNITTMKAPYVSVENQQKINEFDKAIAWWKNSLANETSELQQEAKQAILRKLKHARRKLKEQEEGTSVVIVWKNIRDTAIETYDDFAGYVAENFNELFLEETPSISETLKSSDENDSKTPSL